MTTRPPADVGMPVADIDTRALVVSPDAYERNLDRMAAPPAGTPARLRDDAKTHNCPVVALHHIARGAVGRTINLNDWYVAVRRGRVEALWPITARGAVP